MKFPPKKRFYSIVHWKIFPDEIFSLVTLLKAAKFPGMNEVQKFKNILLPYYFQSPNKIKSEFELDLRLKLLSYICYTKGCLLRGCGY